MTNYVIKIDKDSKIIEFYKYKNEKFSIELIKKKIDTWNNTIGNIDRFELIEDAKTIEVLDFIHRFEDDKDMETKVGDYESAISQISDIVNRLI